MLSTHPAPTPRRSHPRWSRGRCPATRPRRALGLHPAGGGRPYRGVLGAVVADEAAAPRVSLCPAADVVDATLDHQPLVAWQVVPADLLPAEGGQRRPPLPRFPVWLPDAAHGCAQKSSRTRDLAERRPRGERGSDRRLPPLPPAAPRPRPAAAASLRACAGPAVRGQLFPPL